jgi:hypothetical protein
MRLNRAWFTILRTPLKKLTKALALCTKPRSGISANEKGGAYILALFVRTGLVPSYLLFRQTELDQCFALLQFTLADLPTLQLDIRLAD